MGSPGWQDAGGCVTGGGPAHPTRSASVLRGHRPGRRLCTSGITPAACSASGWPSRAARRWPTPTCSARSSWLRPLLTALRHPGPLPAVLLIDEVDRADDDFEAFLLKPAGRACGDHPEFGTIRADPPTDRRPHVQPHAGLHDALKRRCPSFHWIDYPDAERSCGRSFGDGCRAVPGCSRSRSLRRSRGCVALGLQKPPGIAEAIDWVGALEFRSACASSTLPQSTARWGRRSKVHGGPAGGAGGRALQPGRRVSSPPALRGDLASLGDVAGSRAAPGGGCPSPPPKPTLARVLGCRPTRVDGSTGAPGSACCGPSTR